MIPFLTALALCYILVKIPSWVVGAARGGGGRSFLGGLLRGFLAYKTFGLLRGRLGPPAAKARQKVAADPYESPKATSAGQYMLPLNVARQRRSSPSRPQNASKPKATQQRRADRGQQLKLPLDGEWPENKPRLDRDGQYRLPLNVQPQPAPKRPGPSPEQPTRRPRTQQLRLPADGQWPENRPVRGRDGQYRLPFDVQRVQRPATPVPPSPLAPPRSPRPPARQLKLPADGEWPENKPRLRADGQYQLPLQVQRVPRRTPASPSPPPVRPTSRPRSMSGRQPVLPLTLPKVRPPRPSTRRLGGER